MIRSRTLISAAAANLQHIIDPRATTDHSFEDHLAEARSRDTAAGEGHTDQDNSNANEDFLRNLKSRIQSNQRSIASSLFEIGRLLNLAKEEVPHGRFAEWVELELPDISMRTAQRMMSAATAFAGKYDTVSYLPAKTIYALAQDKHSELRHTIVCRSEGPSPPSRDEVAHLLEASSTSTKTSRATAQKLRIRTEGDGEPNGADDPLVITAELLCRNYTGSFDELARALEATGAKELASLVAELACPSDKAQVTTGDDAGDRAGNEVLMIPPPR